MENDFPAAHSMDTTWFAVDRDGRVGVFFSGENGQVPAVSGVAEDLNEAVHFLRATAVGKQPSEDEVWGWLYDEEQLARHGLFVFWYPGRTGGLADPYVKDWEPERPVHVDQLPPAFRDQCRRVQFPVSFAEVRLVQPCEHCECSFWYEAAGYRSADGRTVRAFPGREEECRQFLEEYRVANPVEAGKWHLEEEPPGEGG